MSLWTHCSDAPSGQVRRPAMDFPPSRSRPDLRTTVSARSKGATGAISRCVLRLCVLDVVPTRSALRCAGRVRRRRGFGADDLSCTQNRGRELRTVESCANDWLQPTPLRAFRPALPTHSEHSSPPRPSCSPVQNRDVRALAFGPALHALPRFNWMLNLQELDRIRHPTARVVSRRICTRTSRQPDDRRSGGGHRERPNVEDLGEPARTITPVHVARLLDNSDPNRATRTSRWPKSGEGYDDHGIRDRPDHVRRSNKTGPRFGDADVCEHLRGPYLLG